MSATVDNNEWINTKKHSVTDLRTSTGDDAVSRTNLALRMAIGNPIRRKLPPTDPFSKPDYIDDAVRKVQQSLGPAVLFAQTGASEPATIDWCSQVILPQLPEFIRNALQSKDDTLVHRATVALNAAAYRVRLKESMIRANERAKEESKSSPAVAARIKVTTDRFTPKSSASAELNNAMNGGGAASNQQVEDKLSPVMERLSQAVVEKKQQQQIGPPRAPRAIVASSASVSLIKEIPDSSFARDAEVLDADISSSAVAAPAADASSQWIMKEPDFLSSSPPPAVAIETPVSPCIGESADATIAPNDKETATPPSPLDVPAMVHNNDDNHHNKEQKVPEEPALVENMPGADENKDKSLENGMEEERNEQEENSSVVEEKKAPVEEIGSESSEDAAEEDLGDDEEDEAEAREYFEKAEQQAMLEAQLVNEDGIIENDDSEEASEVGTGDVKELAITRAKRNAKLIAHQIIDKITEETKLKKQQKQQQQQKKTKKNKNLEEEDDSSSSSYQESAAEEDDDDSGSASSNSDKEEKQHQEGDISVDDAEEQQEEEQEQPKIKAKPQPKVIAVPAKSSTTNNKKKAKTETERVQEAAIEVFGRRILLVKQEADIVAKAEPGRKKRKSSDEQEEEVTSKKTKSKTGDASKPKVTTPPSANGPSKESLSDDTIHAYLLTSIALYAEHFLRSEGQQSRLQRLASKAPSELTEEETEERFAFRACFYRDRNPALRAKTSNELYKLAHQTKEHFVALKKRNPLALRDLMNVLLQPESTYKFTKLEQLTDKSTIEWMRSNRTIDSPISCDAEDNTCLIEVTGTRPWGTEQVPWSTEMFVSGADAEIFETIYFASHSAEAVDESIRRFLRSQGLAADAKDTSLTESYLASSYPDEIISRWMHVYHNLQK